MSAFGWLLFLTYMAGWIGIVALVMSDDFDDLAF